MKAKVHEFDWEFRVGQRVVKPEGYPFPGIVVVRFLTLVTGNERYVVDFTDFNGIPTGLMHIFSASQLKADDAEAADPRRDAEAEIRNARNAMLSRQGLKPEDAP